MAAIQRRAFGVVLLGASQFDEMHDLDNPAFRASKQRMSALLTAEYLLADDVRSLDLFDGRLRPDDIVGEVKDFLERGPPLTDFILYYCGHGTIRHPDTLCLLLRLSRRGQEATTTLKLADFRYDLAAEMAGKRTFIFLDCCYAAAALKDLMGGPSLSPLMSRQIETAGTALFAAASVDFAAQAPAGRDFTLFSGHLADAIGRGVPGAATPDLSLSVLAEYVREQIQLEPESRRVMPELHTPRLLKGNIALTPLFRNKAWSPASNAGAAPAQPDPPARAVDLRFNKRPHDLCLVFHPADRPQAARLAGWLTGVAGLTVTSDDRSLSGGARAPKDLAARLSTARAAMFCVSAASLAAGRWDEAAHAAWSQVGADPRFHLLVALLDDCGAPAALADASAIELPTFTEASAAALLEALVPEPAPWSHGDRDVYLSRSWHPADFEATEVISRSLASRGFRLIGDSPDYAVLDADSRVRRIIGTCGALVAALPYRDDAANGFTSKWMLEEVRLARDLGRPYLLFAAPGVEIGEALRDASFGSRIVPLNLAPGDPELETTLDRFEDDYRPAAQTAYCFFATSLRRGEDNTQTAVDLVERVTSMPCLLGERLQGQAAQREIIDRIRGAEFVIADISGNDHNSLIEAGIARGAGVSLNLVCETPASGDLHTRFMFRDLEVGWYRDGLERLGKIHRIARLYRRRVINPASS